MNLTEELSAFANKKILVIGDIILDIYLHGKVDRISPEAPIPIVNHSNTKHALGGAANVAANLKGLGADVSLISIVGNDHEAEYLLTMLELEEIGANLIKTSKTTTSKTRVIASNHQMLRIDHENTEDIAQDEEENLKNDIQVLIRHWKPEAIVLEDYNKGMLTKNIIQFVLEQAQSNEIPIVVDPKKKNFFDYTGSTIFKPNLKECAAQIPFHITPEPDSLSKADDYLRDRLRHKITMITLAEHGIFISDGKNKMIVPTSVHQVADVSGAGDTVTAIATFGILQSLSLQDIATVSNMAAGIVCNHSGVYAIQKDELIKSN